MKPHRVFVPMLPMAAALMWGGCRSGGHDADIEPAAGPVERDVVVVTRHEPEPPAEHRRVWRFPFVEIALDPIDPGSVGVHVGDEDEGRTWVNLNVNWDD